MNLDISTLADKTGFSVRRLRYVLDQKLVPGMEVAQAGRGSARQFTEFQAFAVTLAAALLEVGYARSGVLTIMLALDGANQTRKQRSLYGIFKSKQTRLEVGDLKVLKCQLLWYVMPDLEKSVDIDPTVITVVWLSKIRRLLAA